MAQLSEEKDHLLDSEEGSVPQGPVAFNLHIRWQLPVAVALLLAAGAATVALMGPHKDHNRETAALDSLEQFYTATATCYAYTGGTCTVTGRCNADRNSVCRRQGVFTVKKKCVCEGGCVGHDGICQSAVANQLVATEFTLTNYKYSSYLMYFQSLSAFGQLKLTNSLKMLNLGKDKLALYQLPSSRNVTARFFLNSVAFPGSVARFARRTGVVSRYGVYATDLTKNYGPDALALSVCWNAEKNAMMFGNVDGTVWAYAKHLTWLVYGYKDTTRSAVGDGGLWKPNPMFTAAQIAMLPAC